MRFIGDHLSMLNHNGILAWSVAAWGIAWCVAVWRRAHRRKAGRHGTAAPSGAARRGDGWRALREEPVLHYLTLVVGGAVVLALAALRASTGADVRYFSTFVPFAAIIAAAMVCWAWRMARPAGIALGAALLLSNLAGWPFLDSLEHGDTPAWTLPALAAEYHRDYSDSLRESLGYIRTHAREDALIYTNYSNPGWMLWYLSDKVLFCCTLSRGAGHALRTDGRAYLFRQDVFRSAAGGAGALTPEYLFMVDQYTVREVLTLGNNGLVYRRIADFPGAVMGIGPLVRPEPVWHASRPERLRGPGANVMQLYRRERT